VGLERGPLSLVSKIEELLERKSSGSGLESREYGRRDSAPWPRGTLYPQKLALTSPTSGCRAVGIVRSQTQAMEFSFLVFLDLARIHSTHSAFQMTSQWWRHLILPAVRTVFTAWSSRHWDIL
jgi:hypothetical protein